MSIYSRKAMAHLNQWIQNKVPKPLVLRGARQVGKSTLVEHFAYRSRRPLHKMNLETHRLLTRDLTEPRKLLTEIEALTQKSIQNDSISHESQYFVRAVRDENGVLELSR